MTQQQTSKPMPKSQTKAPADRLSRELRQTLRQKRNSLSKSAQQQHSQRIIRTLLHQLTFLKAKKVGVYWATDGEVNLSKLFRLPGKQFYWPVLQESVRPWQGRGLLFAEASHQWKANRYGIPEPRKGRLVKAQDLDYLLVPLVGFDSRGNRLGMGGGYYDRTLAKLPSWKAIHLTGVAHDAQKVDELAYKAWDIPMNDVVTESGFVDKQVTENKA